MAKSTYSVSGLKIALQGGTDRTYYASWSFSHSHLDSFSVIWQYQVNGVWFEGSNGSSPANVRTSTYSAPENALSIRVKVKPVSTKHKVNKKDVTYWNGSWGAGWVEQGMPSSTAQTPDVPSSIDVKADKFTLTATVDCYDPKTEAIEFEIVQDDAIKAFATKADVVMNRASISWSDMVAGSRYKVRCRGAKYITSKAAQQSNSTFISSPSKPTKTASKKKKKSKAVLVQGTATSLTSTASNSVANYEIVRTAITSDWSNYSSDVYAPPEAVTGVAVEAVSTTQFKVSWDEAANASKYVVEYTNNEDYFKTNPSAIQSQEITDGTIALISVDNGDKYFFRVKVETKDNGESGWSDIESCATGRQPNAPTTWSSTSTTYVGRNVTLYWTHNAADGSRERRAQLELTVNGVPEIKTIENEAIENLFLDDTGTYSEVFETKELEDGATLEWRVRTQGAIDTYSEWSVSRTVDIYAPPSLTLSIGKENRWLWDSFNFETDDIYSAPGALVPFDDNILTSFPLFVQLYAQPYTQTPVTYYISIVSNDTYDDIDDTGTGFRVSAGDEVFSQFYESSKHLLTAIISAGDINLDTSHSYTIKATVAMDSSLSADAKDTFSVSWDDESYDVDIEDQGVDADLFAIYMKPYCNDENGDPVPDVSLSVYRQTFDGMFVEIASGIDNMIQPTIVDPHPALDYGRYRVVAKSNITGRVFFYDAPPIPIGETSIVIQWDETIRALDTDEEEAVDLQPWSGNILVLPWNVDVSESNDKDVEHVAYIGRRHPVSYYGTQVGQKGSWKTTIDKYDFDTIDLLRRLAVYMGDVYVREPSGVGYWATINVSFGRDHNSVTSPVTIEVTRVEGGA